MTDIEILIAARDLISNPARWTQNFLAKDEYEYHVDPLSPDAVCWCAFGAIEKVGDDWKSFLLGKGASKFLVEASEELFRDGVSTVNDTLGHQAILAVYDRAIELAGQNGS